MTNLDLMLLAGNMLFFGLWINGILSTTKLKGVLRTALRKAERDNCDRVRIPYNQLAGLMGWTAEFEQYKFDRTPGRKARKSDPHVRTSVYPMREVK